MKRLTKYTVRFIVVVIFVLATLITASIAIGLQYYFSKSMATESATHLFELSSNNVKNILLSVDTEAEQLVRTFAQFGNLVKDNKINDDALSVFREILKTKAAFYSAYIGFGNGNFYELINLQVNNSLRKKIKASLKDRWVTIAVLGVGNKRKRIFTYLDENLNVRITREEASTFDASIRPWFKHASLKEVYKSAPYLFERLQTPGKSYSIKIPNSNAVLGVDLVLSSYTQYLVNQDSSVDTLSGKQIYLFQKTGEIIASNQNDNTEQNPLVVDKLLLSDEQVKLIANTPPLKVSNETNWAPIDFSVSGRPQGYSIDVLTMISEMTGLTFDYFNGYTWPEFLSHFKAKKIDVLQPVFKTQKNEQIGLLSTPFMQLPFAVITQSGQQEINALSQLKGRRLAIPKGWSIIEIVRENFPEIILVELPSTKAVLEAVKREEVFAGLDNEIIFRYTQQQFFIKGIQYHQKVSLGAIELPTSLHFMLDHVNPKLMAIINLAIENISNKQYQVLQDKWLATATKLSSFKQGIVPYAELISLAEQDKNHGGLLLLTFNGIEYFVYITPIDEEKENFLGIIIPSENVFAASVDKVRVSITITSICLLFLLPISWFFSSPIVKPIKLLAQENEKIKNRQFNKVKKVVSSIKEIDELATSLVEMSLSIRKHEKNQRELMDSFIKLIAQTIDNKSPYTGGHCNRVPELGLMLVDAAVTAKQGPFKNFEFTSEDELREFKIAAWLHDCGKIITPEHIVDKGSKLETIYNRIHEVRMRFEVLWRDAQIDYYQQVGKQPEQQEQLKIKLDKQFIQLKGDFEFIAESNVGGEFMSDERVVRLKGLSSITWQRYFDDTLGLSPAEELNLTGNNQSLPVTEYLLNDKAEHIIKRGKQVVLDEKYGIKMPPPEHKYNLGELYNLSISRGTLTNEDRYKINEHIIGTINMLEQLPFPPELANVPKYASTHHETLIGTGYPRKLSADDLTIPERILVIADIFEALTAADRPYKKAKSLSLSVDILHKFALDQHIDFELFELFLTSGVYLQYGEKYLKPEQVDTVDIAKYLRKNEKIS